MTLNMSFKSKLADPSRRLTAHMCAIPSAIIPQTMASAGSDAVVIDFEHGAIDMASAHAMIAATAGTACAPLVRVSRNDATQVKRVLDLGAEGVVFPMINTAEEAEMARNSLAYPPTGIRGFGPYIAHSRWGTRFVDYPETAEAGIVCCLLIETREAVENIREICTVPGIDALMIAPFDLSVDLHLPGQFTAPEFQEAVATVEAAANDAAIPLGSVAMDKAQADALLERGYRIIAGLDILWLKQMAAVSQSWVS
ncbi:hypothetical protein AVO45_17290 [Ruegeria marisrubri]|uniref:HpcH/HpaI aldolase/citrate lyase domain-containing protein n=1 Tax=Ruegeria marisrubri TaxID=1685379 RepID=A0A0X3UAZ1_9RHOB|nr:aldolase/citrate lyase family protein [Ruegeria marisrubri]KUJ85257.1 hypothetical protein AVO45_17290 [Ruegeria marisrubri]